MKKIDFEKVFQTIKAWNWVKIRTIVFRVWLVLSFGPMAIGWWLGFSPIEWHLNLLGMNVFGIGFAVLIGPPAAIVVFLFFRLLWRESSPLFRKPARK